MTPKQNRAAELAACIEPIAAHFGCDPVRLFSSFNRPGEAVKNARNLLWYHMHDCGMSYYAIARIFKLSDTHVARSARQGMLRLSDADREVLARVPRISNTLEFVGA
jgi:hypothetical protein